MKTPLRQELKEVARNLKAAKDSMPPAPWLEQCIDDIKKMMQQTNNRVETILQSEEAKAALGKMLAALEVEAAKKSPAIDVP